MSSTTGGRPVRILTALLVAVGALALAAGPASAHPQTVAQQEYAVRGGDLLYGDHGGSCTVGFNAGAAGGARYGILLSSCAGGASTWYADPARTVVVGTSSGSGFPNSGTATLVRYTNSEVSYPGEVALGDGTTVDITGSGSPYVGERVCHPGRTTGLRCGTVQALNVTVHFPDDIVHGLFRATDCAAPGDVGAPSFDGGRALGIVVGGSSCSAGGSAFHLPVAEVLNAYGLTVY
ncbi:hypothetical protein N566_19170 [Streptomycetaceae bacterium MP113-05]|nr:hypothetical protein N566_19170 [Streptomycetaceae bacterium MP113-05]